MHIRYLITLAILFTVSLVSTVYYKSSLYHGGIEVSPYEYPHGMEYVWTFLLVGLIGLKYIFYDSVAHFIMGKRASKMSSSIFYIGLSLTIFADGWLIFQSLAPQPDASYMMMHTFLTTAIILAVFLATLAIMRSRKSPQ